MQHVETKTKRGKFEARVFDSIDELIDATRQVPDSRVLSKVDRPAFIGRSFHEWENVYAAMQEPWQEGLDVLDRMERDLADANLPVPVSRKRRTRFNEDNGDELDYDRLRSGRSFWRESRRQSCKGPSTVTIVVDVCTSCGKRPEDIIWRGAAAITLAKMLEAAGYRVELWAVAMTECLWNGNIAGMNAVKLKGPSDPLDTVALINAVSGWAFRTLWLRTWCMGSKEVHHALGYVTVPNSDELDFVSRDANRVLIHSTFSYRDAVALVRRSVERITGQETR